MKALDLYEREKLTQAEIAGRLGVAQSTVSTWISRARQEKEQDAPWPGFRRVPWRVIIRYAYLMALLVCAMITTAAIAHIAWP